MELLFVRVHSREDRSTQLVTVTLKKRIRAKAFSRVAIEPAVILRFLKCSSFPILKCLTLSLTGFAFLQWQCCQHQLLFFSLPLFLGLGSGFELGYNLTQYTLFWLESPSVVAWVQFIKNKLAMPNSVFSKTVE